MIKKIIVSVIPFFFAVLCGCLKDKAQLPVAPICENEISFVNEVRLLIISRCADNSCHAFLMNGSDLVFSNYSDISQAATQENFLGAIKHIPGFSIMPQDTTQLLPEEIRMIECWIIQGRKNN